jgi:putative transposase
MRKSYSSDFKTKVVIDILKGDRTLNEVASEHGVHPNMAARWKKEFLQNCHRAFDDDGKASERNEQLKEELEDVYKQLGIVTAKYEWLKKKSGE